MDNKLQTLAQTWEDFLIAILTETPEAVTANPQWGTVINNYLKNNDIQAVPQQGSKIDDIKDKLKFKVG